MKKLCLAVVSLAVLASAAPASASHSWGGYHWARTANPFTVAIGDNVNASWDSYLGGAARDWSIEKVNNSPLNHTFAPNPLDATTVTPGNDIGREKQCRATPGRVEACNARYGFNGWLGVATVWASGGHISQATVKVNDSYYSTAKYNTPTWRAAVTCQEVGHTFGLDHQDESGNDFHTCMDYASNPHDDNMHPNEADYSELGAIYEHLDSSTTLAAPATTGRGLRRVRDDVFAEDLADGGKRYVFVYWTQPGNHYNAPAGA